MTLDESETKSCLSEASPPLIVVTLETQYCHSFGNNLDSRLHYLEGISCYLHLFLEVAARLPAVGGGDSHALIHTRGWALETKEEKGFDVMEAMEQAENFHHLSFTLHFFLLP